MSSPTKNTKPTISNIDSPPPPLLTSNKVTVKCHCGRIKIDLPGPPDQVKECRCSLCYRYGALWTYFQDENEVTITADEPGAKSYEREDGNKFAGFYHCAHCGCLTHWWPTKEGEAERKKNPAGRSAVGVNCRMLPPGMIEGIKRIVAREGDFRV